MIARKHKDKVKEIRRDIERDRNRGIYIKKEREKER